MIYAEPEGARRNSAQAIVAYMLRQDTNERALFATTANLMLGIAEAADEIDRTIARALALSRRGRRADRPVLHFVLSWHPGDRPRPAHMIETAMSALAALGLAEHQAVIVGHADTKAMHVHVAVSVIHPDTGKAAKLGWRWRTMSRWAAAYEATQGVIRCGKRGVAKGKNESRKRIPKPIWQMSDCQPQAKDTSVPHPPI